MAVAAVTDAEHERPPERSQRFEEHRIVVEVASGSAS
jgi:hypothetical protein